MIKEKRRRQRLLKKVLIGILVFMILTVIAIFVVINVFVIKEVKVEGNELYDEQLITDTVLNDEYSWNSLYVFLKYAFVDTKEVPFIDAMEVRLEDPQTLKIKVYEKGMMGYLYIPAIGENAYFDKDGFVVEISTRIIEGVPKMEGINCDEVVLYEKLPIDNQKLRDMLTLTKALDGIKPDSIHFGLKKAPVLFYGDTEVWLGSNKLLTQKIACLKDEKVLPSIKGIAGIVHMENWSEENRNFIFEKKLEEPDTEEAPSTEDEPSIEDAPGIEDNPSVEEPDVEGESDGDLEGGDEFQDAETGNQDAEEEMPEEGNPPQDTDENDENQGSDVSN